MSGDYASFYTGIRGASRVNQMEPGAAGLAEAVNAIGVSTPNPTTLVVELEQPDAVFLQFMALWPSYPLRQDVIDQHGDRWIEADSSLTVRGESVAGSVWLNHVCEQIRGGQARVSLDDLTTYAAYERRSLAMWATQELGDDLGGEFVARTTIGERDVARLKAGGGPEAWPQEG